MPEEPRESRGQEAGAEDSHLARTALRPASGPRFPDLSPPLPQPLLSAPALPGHPDPGTRGGGRQPAARSRQLGTLTFPSGATPSMRGVAARLRGKCWDGKGGRGGRRRSEGGGRGAEGAGPRGRDAVGGSCGASLPGPRPPRVGQAFSSGSPGPCLVLCCFFPPRGRGAPTGGGWLFFFFPFPLN